VLARPVEGPKAPSFIGTFHDRLKTEVVGVFERAAEIAQQAHAEDEAHIDIPRRSGDATMAKINFSVDRFLPEMIQQAI
jgi:hypothetical protein